MCHISSAFLNIVYVCQFRSYFFKYCTCVSVLFLYLKINKHFFYFTQLVECFHIDGKYYSVDNYINIKIIQQYTEPIYVVQTTSLVIWRQIPYFKDTDTQS